jgi:tripartite-type tricarboxylate transporter receptor subunit TctC
MPRDVVDRLAAGLARVLAVPEVQAKFAAAGAEVHYQGPEAFAAFVRSDNEKWAKLIRDRKIQLD